MFFFLKNKSYSRLSLFQGQNPQDFIQQTGKNGLKKRADKTQECCHDSMHKIYFTSTAHVMGYKFFSPALPSSSIQILFSVYSDTVEEGWNSKMQSRLSTVRQMGGSIARYHSAYKKRLEVLNSVLYVPVERGME